MAITREAFEALVARLEPQARQRPRAYRLRVALLALLGYGYLAGVLLALAALVLASLASTLWLKALAIKLILPLGAFLWLVLRALWVRIEAPKGIALDRRESPELFVVIDRLRRALRAPCFHRVLLTDDFNAAVVQVPRLGLFGWHRNYLLLGLPLLKCTTPAQLQAILAHEFGHLAGGHARFGNQIYRLRMAWARLQAALERPGQRGAFLFRPFFRWYAPYFAAYSFPLARANEYEADAVSARLTSPRTVAEALTGTSVIGRYLGERYWPDVHRQADEQPQPAFAPFARLGAGLRGAIDETAARAWLDGALAARTTADDTHPCLADRLRAVGEAPRFNPPGEGEGADRLLGAARERLVAELDARWAERIRHDWQEHYRRVQEGRARLAALEAAAQTGELSLDEAFERARLDEAYGAGADAALAQFRALHARAPDSAPTCYALGTRLLARDDAAGVALVERAMQLDEEAIAPGAEALRDFHWRRGDRAAADHWHARLCERRALLEAARAERAQIRGNDKFLRHDLAPPAVADLRAALAAAGARRAYLVRKRVKHLPERPLYALGFRVTPWWRRRRAAEAAAVQQRIVETVALPATTLVFCVEGKNARFDSKFRWIRGARVL